MRQLHLIVLLCVLTVILAACDMTWVGQEERKNLEAVIYFEVTAANVEHSASVDSLLADGDIEAARKMLQMGIFLDLKDLDQLTRQQFRSKLGARPVSIDEVDLERKALDLQSKYYTAEVRDAGRRYVDIPSDVKYIRESREYLEKMKRIGLPSQ